MSFQKSVFKTIAKNKKAYHNYFVEESFEAGIALTGTEVKSIRNGAVNLVDAWCAVEKGEIFVKGLHISPYEQGNIFNTEPRRPRKLLMHKREILNLMGHSIQQGYTLIPLSVYLKGNLVKVQIGLCRGKKQYDKREVEARKEMLRTADRAMKEHMR